MSERGWTAAVESQLSAHARTLFEATDEGMLSLDLQGRCILVNAAARRMLGYEHEEILGEELHPLVHHSRPDGSPYPEEECPVYRAFRIGENCRVGDEVFWRRDGSPFPVEYSSRPIVVEGRITGAVVTFLDITERKHAEEELRRSYRRTENVVESITDAFVAVDRRWRYTYVNERALRRMRARRGEEGLTREEVLGKNMWEMFPDAVGTTIYHRCHEAVREQRTVEFETYFPPSDEWIEAHAYPSEEGLSVYYRNVTGRKRAEEQRAYHAHLLENMNDAVLATDERYVLTAWNKGAEQMYGWTAEEALGRNVGEVLRSEITDERRAEILRQLAETGRYRYELLMYHKDGTPIYVDGVTVALRGERDRVTGYLSINRDMTERKRSEEELRESEIFVRSTLNSLSAHIAILDETGLILATNRAWRGFTEANPPFTASAETGTNYLEVCDAATGEGAEEAAAFARGIRGVISGRQDSFEMEYPCHSPGERRWFAGRVTRFPGTHPPKVVVAHENITERQLAMEEIELRALQQEAVADLGRRALAEPDLPILMDEAAEVVARTLDVEFCKILELLPEGDDLLLRAGVGWERGLFGTATEKAGTGSQAGYALLEDGPVILEDLAGETRFERTPLLREHGVVSGASTVIRGYEEPFGVLEAHTRSRRDFTEDDVNFLRAVANVLGEAIEWRRAEERMGDVREAERGRMARDLHDGPLQDLTYALTAAQLARSLSKDEKLNRWLEGTVEALKRTGQELRAAVHDLRLEEQRGRPFPELVEYLVDLNRRMTPDREIRLDVAGEFPASPLGENDTELLRIVQEALTNTRRHSEARSVVVSLGVDEGRVWTQVEDDGRGFGPGTASGIGLKSIRERARSLGGDLSIEGWPGRGARVRFALAPESANGREDKKAAPDCQIRVLLVEDHVSFRDAAAAVFEREPGFTVSGQAGSLAGARELIESGSLSADVAIVDLGLPDGYGGDLIRDLRETNPRAQALVLSATLDRTEMARAVEAGAAGVLHKSAGMDEVLDAVGRLLAGETLMPLEEVVEMLRLAASHRDEEHDAHRAIAQLTPRELEVLEALAEGLDGKEIARRLRISDKTERNHMASIMAKLGVHSRLQALIFALRHGAADIG